jgi:hypothetical protein
VSARRIDMASLYLDGVEVMTKELPNITMVQGDTLTVTFTMTIGDHSNIVPNDEPEQPQENVRPCVCGRGVLHHQDEYACSHCLADNEAEIPRRRRWWQR